MRRKGKMTWCRWAALAVCVAAGPAFGQESEPAAALFA